MAIDENRSHFTRLVEFKIKLIVAVAKKDTGPNHTKVKQTAPRHSIELYKQGRALLRSKLIHLRENQTKTLVEKLV